jgi:predicted DNA-binding protein
MGHTITVRLPKDSADWLAATSRETGLPQGRIIRDQIEKAMAANKPYLRLAGAVSGPPDLSSRKGFLRK